MSGTILSQIKINSQHPHVIDVKTSDLFTLKPQITSEQPYDDYVHIGFELDVECIGSFEILFQYESILMPAKARHAKWALFSQGNGWRFIETIINEELCVIKGSATGNCRLTLFVNSFFYSKFTQSIANEFPSWTKAKQDHKSNMQQFLNAWGILFERLDDAYRSIRNAKYVSKERLSHASLLYVYSIPKTIGKSFNVQDQDGRAIHVANTIDDFFVGLHQSVMIDSEQMQLYSFVAHDPIVLMIDEKEYKIKPKEHLIWNHWDEWALLCGLKRLPTESNQSLKKRIGYVFQYQPSTTLMGMAYGIANAMGAIRSADWINDQLPFVIDLPNDYNIQKMILHSIRLNGQPLLPQERAVEPEQIILTPTQTGLMQVVSWIDQIQMNSLLDLLLEKNNLLYQENGRPTSFLIQILNELERIYPIMFAHAFWGVQQWVSLQQSIQALPTYFDADLNAFQNQRIAIRHRKDEAPWKLSNN